MATLDQIRAAGERDIENAMATLDRRHAAMLIAAIEQYGSVRQIPAAVWDEIQRDQEDELAAVILLLLLSADEWTELRIADQGVRSGERADQAAYALDAARAAQQLAARTTSTLRDRLARKLEDSALTGPGQVGTVTAGGIRAAVDNVLTDSRRATIAVDLTTASISRGQLGAKRRIAGDDGELTRSDFGHASSGVSGDGASLHPGQRVRVEMLWIVDEDHRLQGRVCPRCAPLDGKPESVWGAVFPDGPGEVAHPNCACRLDPVVVATEQAAATESFRESEDERGARWVTIRGNAVKISDDGTMLTGPLQGQRLGGGDDAADQMGKTASQKGWSKKVLQVKAAQANLDPAKVQAARSKYDQERNPRSVNPPMSVEQKAAAKDQREREQQHEAARHAATTTQIAASVSDLERSSLSPADKIAAVDFVRQSRSPREAKQYAAAAVSWNDPRPERAAIALAVGELKKRGVAMREKGKNGSFYGVLSDGRTVRVADHLGFDGHDVELVFAAESPVTKQQAMKIVGSELESL